MAVQMAEAWIASHWLRAGPAWTTLYTLKPEPKVPFGMATFGRTSIHKPRGDPQQALPAQDIHGAVKIDAVTCAVYQINPGTQHVVRYSGRNLRFDENGKGWSRPVPSAVLHVFEIGHTRDRQSTLGLRELDDARTSLPADAVLSLPAAVRSASPPGAKSP